MPSPHTPIKLKPVSLNLQGGVGCERWKGKSSQLPAKGQVRAQVPRQGGGEKTPTEHPKGPRFATLVGTRVWHLSMSTELAPCGSKVAQRPMAASQAHPGPPGPKVGKRKSGPTPTCASHARQPTNLQIISSERAQFGRNGCSANQKSPQKRGQHPNPIQRNLPSHFPNLQKRQQTPRTQRAKVHRGVGVLGEQPLKIRASPNYSVKSNPTMPPCGGGRITRFAPTGSGRSLKSLT